MPNNNLFPETFKVFKRKNLVCKCTPDTGIVLMIKRNNKSL